MLDNKLRLINEQTSPLFRIMSVFNHGDTRRRVFTNNICAFHIGGGRILSVAHNLRTEAGVVNSFDEVTWQSAIATRIDSVHPLLQQYQYDAGSDRRNLIQNPNAKLVTDTLRQINFDTRWISLYEKKICNPYLIVQFGNDQFYNNAELTKFFGSLDRFHEPSANRHTFIIELILEEAIWRDDIALYRIADKHRALIDALPHIEADYNLYDSGSQLYCLQSAPGGFLGRLVNNANIEGFLDHHQFFYDRIGGNHVMEGLRYLIRGYFRFGSSGAPYVYFDGKNFKAVAVQSEASPIQLSINNSREGNFQYVNAIATPLRNIREKLETIV